MAIVRVNLKNNPYNIHFGHKLFPSIPSEIKKLNLGNFAIVITSSRVHALYKTLISNTFRGKNYKIVTIADGEKAKSKHWLFSIIGDIVKVDGLNKKPYLICLGGGTVGDVGGFVASIYKRGIPYVQIPTTFLGQIDSSIGGKTAIDLKVAKNILGSFYQPRAVFIDPCFLASLPLPELKQGLAEVIKYGVIKDSNFFVFIEKKHQEIINLERAAILKVILTSVKIKARIVEQDERELSGLRTILNFGHTFGHALESSLKYQKISHGEAVALGMIFAAKLSLKLKKCSQNSLARLSNLIRLFGLPTRIKANPSLLYRALTYDKKFISGKIRMVLLKAIGKVEVVDGISAQKIKETLKA